MIEERCGLVLNRLFEPCRLERLHEGFHESLSLTSGRRPVVCDWWTSGAPSRERRYRFDYDAAANEDAA